MTLFETDIESLEVILWLTHLHDVKTGTVHVVRVMLLFLRVIHLHYYTHDDTQVVGRDRTHRYEFYHYSHSTGIHRSSEENVQPHPHTTYPAQD